MTADGLVKVVHYGIGRPLRLAKRPTIEVMHVLTLMPFVIAGLLAGHPARAAAGDSPVERASLTGLTVMSVVVEDLAARGESLAAFDERCIPAGGVAPPSNTPGILSRRALPAGRLARLGATPDFHHGLLGPLVGKLGLATEALQTDVERRLRQAGLSITPDADAYLYVHVTVADPGASLPLPYVVDVSLMQEVTLPRGVKTRTPLQCPTWSVNRLGLATSTRLRALLSDRVNEFVDQFVAAYRSVNPRG